MNNHSIQSLLKYQLRSKRLYVALLLAVTSYLYNRYKERRFLIQSKGIPAFHGLFPLLNEPTLGFAAEPTAFFKSLFDKLDRVREADSTAPKHVVASTILGRDTIFIRDPAHVQFVLSRNATFSSALGFPAPFLKLAKGSLLIKDGAAHRKVRKLVMNALNQEQMQGSLPMMAGHFDDELDRILLAKNPSDRTIEWYSHFKVSITLFMFKLLFGVDGRGSTAEVVTWLSDFGKALLALPLEIPGVSTEFSRGLDARKKIDALAAEWIDKRRSSDCAKTQHRRHHDLLQTMCDYVDPETGETASSDEIAAQCLATMFASSDTTANTLGQFFYQVDRHPQRERMIDLIREECRKVWGVDQDDKNVRVWTNLSGEEIWSRLERQTFLGNALQESGRINAIAAFTTRVATVDTELPESGGLVIPKDTTVFVCFSEMFKHEDFFPDPDSFKPERFAEQGVNEKDAGYRNAQIPFSSGAHSCAGQKFAVAMMKMMVTLCVLKDAWPKQVRERDPSAGWKSLPTWEANGGLDVTF